MHGGAIFRRSVFAGSIFGVACLSLSFLVPVLSFYLFNILPLSGDSLYGITEAVWGPQKLFLQVLNRLSSRDLLVNSLYVAPLINGILGSVMGFLVCYTFLRFRRRFRSGMKSPPTQSTG